MATKLVFRQICYTKFKAYLFISTRYRGIELNSRLGVKAITCKAKAKGKDLVSEVKAKAKDLTF